MTICKSFTSSFFAVMSIVGFLSMYVDKTKAKRRKWRTPEWVLFLIAVLFGGVGSTAGMYVFRHKTRHWYFKVFMPCLAVIDIVALALLCVYVA